VVTRDVPPYAMVAGVPARVMGYMCERGERLAFGGDGLALTSYGQRYRRLPSGLVRKEEA
jgi:UDP-2-acetamido-3-amino-2,3-dideoxy-glucuronate N-acetyltransferase